MHSDDIGARQGSRYPEKLRDMHNIATQPFDDVPELHVSLDCGIRLKQWNNVEISREFTNFGRGGGRTDQEVIIRSVDSAQGPHDVSGIGTRPEFRCTPDVNRDLHRMILTIVAAAREEF